MKKSKIKFTRVEKLLYALTALLVISLPLAVLFSQATLSKLNIEVESMKVKIQKQANINESMTMKINELVSLDKIQTVANSYGLAYNNDNIKTID